MCTHTYFLDEMSIPDLQLMTKYLEYQDVQSWCHTRQIMLASLAPYLKNKKTKPSDIMHLPIDDDILESQLERQKISNEDVDWFRQFKENYNKKEEKDGE